MHRIRNIINYKLIDRNVVEWQTIEWLRNYKSNEINKLLSYCRRLTSFFFPSYKSQVLVIFISYHLTASSTHVENYAPLTSFFVWKQ